MSYHFLTSTLSSTVSFHLAPWLMLKGLPLLYFIVQLYEPPYVEWKYAG